MENQTKDNLFSGKKPKVSLLSFNFLSEYLGRQTTVNILLPYGCYTQSTINVAKPYKTMLLLHGKSDDYSSWLRCSVIENLARDYSLAVIMPDAGNSFYADMSYGADYYSYIVKELPEVLRGILPLSAKKEDNFIAGYSMGGYGALKIGLNNPQSFSAIGCFSPAVDVVGLAESAILDSSRAFDNAFLNDCITKRLNPEKVKHQMLADKKLFFDAYGDSALDLAGTDNDIYELMKRRLATGDTPPIYQTCGRDDFLYKANLAFSEFASENHCNLCYEESEGGHNWSVWNKNIVDYFNFLKNKGLLM